MATIRFERDEGLVTLRLDRPHGNAINPELMSDLLSAMDEIERDDGIRGVLLASANPRIFCPGLDLQELYPLDRSAMEEFLPPFCASYRRLFALPKPVVAAIAGHAVAGGCVLALCADHRVLADGALLGLNEIRIGLPLPWGVSVLVRQAVLPSRLAEVAMLGRNFQGQDAISAGLAQELAPASEVENIARERLAEYSAKAPAAIAIIKRSLRGESEQAMREGDAARTNVFLDVWFSASTRRTLEDAVRALREKEK